MRGDLPLTPGRWADAAACLAADVDMLDNEQVDAAKAVCARCPVTEKCLAFALRVPPKDDTVGVWGGLTAAERKELRKAA